MKIRQTLDAWSRDPKIASIAYDDAAFAWQLVVQHVDDTKQRIEQFGTKNKFKAWGPAKMVIRRIHSCLIRAKLNGKHVGVRAHTKRDLKQTAGSKW